MVRMGVTSIFQLLLAILLMLLSETTEGLEDFTIAESNETGIIVGQISVGDKSNLR